MEPNRKKKRHPVLWVIAVILVLGWFLPRLSGLPTQAPITREAAAVAPATPTPGPAAAPRPTVRPTATPRQTAKPGPSPAPTPEPTPEPTPTPDQVSPEFKELMDKYEAFFDEYVTFMGEMEENSGSLAWLLRYSEMLSRYAEAMEALDAIDGEALSPADHAYYLQAMTRIEVKLLSALQTGE